MKCAHCEEKFDRSNLYEVDGEFYCFACLHKLGYEVCGECGEIIDADNAIWIEQDSMILCESCANEKYTECDYCGELVRRDALNHIYYSNEDVCNNCLNEHFSECSCCHEIIPNDDLHYWSGTDEWLCAECCEEYEREEEENNRYILDYSSKNPEGLHFHGEGSRYFGIELEIDGGGEEDENAEILLKEMGGYKYAYPKHDGSLNNGIEFPTQPMSYNYFRRDFRPYLNAFCEKALKLGYTAHDAETCGLHIHVSRDALTDDSIKVLWAMFYKFKDEMITFSRRKERQLHFCSLPTQKEIKRTFTPEGDRYQALNLNNVHTIEFRLWRGSLNIKTILAALEFTNAICSWSLNHTMKELDAIAWEAFIVQLLAENETEFLGDYLKVRKLMAPTEWTENTPYTLRDYILDQSLKKTAAAD